MACVPDFKGAVREVSQVYELIKTHQPLLLQHHHGQEAPTTTVQMAQSLLSEALRALNVALSVMKQQQPPPAPAAGGEIKAEPQLSSPSPAASDSEGVTSTTRRAKRRRSVVEGKNSSSWVNLTTVPYEDGYEWRKYGEKRINGTQFTRSYFRCTYKDDKGCLATKYIQQKDNSDPPMFQVTYNNEHTCNCTTTAAKKNSNCNNLPIGGVISPPTAHGGMIKQEQPFMLPPLADVSAVHLDDLMLCQEPFPISNQFYADTGNVNPASVPSSTSTANSSCITGVSCDGIDMGQAALEPLIGYHPELQDLELLLMYDSFNYY